MKKWISAFLLSQISWINFSYSYPVFNNELSFTDFGTVVNQNTSLQTSSQYDLEFPMTDVMRTNNFQTLQLKFGEYLEGRYPCRIGLFNISECQQAAGRIPFGTQISLPAYIFDGDGNLGISCNRFIQQTRDPSFWICSFKETTFNKIETDFSESETAQVAYVTYTTSSMSKYMKNLNVPLSAYHDVEYVGLTPKLVLGKGRVTHIELDGVAAKLPSAGTAVTLIPSTKFKFVIANEPDDPESLQTWLIYAQSDVQKTPITFVMDYKIDKEGYLYDVQLEAIHTYTGYLRWAAIQTDMPGYEENPIRSQTAPDWALATQIQSMPASPLSMFMLWPYDWSKKAGQQILYNQEANVFTTSYPHVSLLLPVLARYNFAVANGWYNQILDKQAKFPTEKYFDSSTNSFMTLFNMLMAKYYDSDIASFQSSIVRGVSTPYISINPDYTTMETMFDDHRSELILNYNINFHTDGSYEFDVTTLDNITTFPQGKATLPLFDFLGFQTIADGYNIIDSAANKDPIKGDVNYVNGNLGSSVGSYTLKFKDQSLPSWANRFIPDDFWNRLSSLEKTSLICQLNQFLNAPLPGYVEGVYEQGKILYQLAVTAKYATYVLLAQQSLLPPYEKNPTIPFSIRQKIIGITSQVKEILDAWLITHQFQGDFVSNYFAADQTAYGVVAIKGTGSPTGGLTDSGNAVYTGHNRQYGYFLLAASMVMELDRLFKLNWIGENVTNFNGATALRQKFIDMLWRDYANPNVMDMESMPYYRYGNSFEGMSSSKGMPPAGAFASRNNESISEDFNGYYATYLYGNHIFSLSDADIPAVDKEGYDGLAVFSLGNLNMITRAGRGLFYNNQAWVYSTGPFAYNITTGTEWDDRADMFVDMERGSPPAYFSPEGAVYSNYRFGIFSTDLIQQLNQICGNTQQGCGCQSEGN